jgi:Amt family ammonium transporter
MAGNGAIAGLVAITAPSGYVEFWAAPVIGAVAGTIVVFGVLTIEKYLDDPVGALSAHGLAGIWGTISLGFFGAPRLIGDTASGGLWYGITDSNSDFGASLGQLGVQTVGVLATFALVFTLSFLTFWAIKATIGLRVSEEEEELGLDISTHGMYGYPEQYIPQPEFPVPPMEPHVAGTPVAASMSAKPAATPSSSIA